MSSPCRSATARCATGRPRPPHRARPHGAPVLVPGESVRIRPTPKNWSDALGDFMDLVECDREGPPGGERAEGLTAGAGPRRTGLPGPGREEGRTVEQILLHSERGADPPGGALRAPRKALLAAALAALTALAQPLTAASPSMSLEGAWDLGRRVGLPHRRPRDPGRRLDIRRPLAAERAEVPARGRRGEPRRVPAPRRLLDRPHRGPEEHHLRRRHGRRLGLGAVQRVRTSTCTRRPTPSSTRSPWRLARGSAWRASAAARSPPRPATCSSRRSSPSATSARPTPPSPRGRPISLPGAPPPTTWPSTSPTRGSPPRSGRPRVSAIEVRAGYAPFAFARDRDRHLLRDKESESDCEGDAWLAGASARLALGGPWFAGVQASARAFRAEGDQEQTLEGEPLGRIRRGN